MEHSLVLATQSCKHEQLKRSNDGPGLTENDKTLFSEKNAEQNVSQSLDSSLGQCIAVTTCPLEQFTLFPDLPSELRLKIWKNAMPDSRVLEILWSASKKYYMDCDNRTPAAMQVCAESRLYAMERYTLVEVGNEEDSDEEWEEESGDKYVGSEDSRTTNGSTSLSCISDRQHPLPLRFYIDPQKDTLYVSLNNSHRTHPYQEKLVQFLTNLDGNVASRLERLSVAFYFLRVAASATRNDVTGAHTLLSRFPMLKIIGMVWSDMCMSTYTDVPENQAPRRKAIDIRALDVSVPFTYYKWDPIYCKVMPRTADELWRSNIPTRISIFREGLTKTGMDKDQVEGLEFIVAEIVRGDLVR